MRFKVIRTYAGNDGVLGIKKCFTSREETFKYHVHLLRMNYNDHTPTSYLCDLNNRHNESDVQSAIISKLCYAPNMKIGDTWGVIASTVDSLDLPSVDQSIIDLVVDPSKSFFDFEIYPCSIFCHNLNEDYYKHLHNGIGREENSRNRRLGNNSFVRGLTCSFFDTVKPYKTASEDVKYFWKNEMLFVLRKHNNKIYEGFQWLNLSNEMKESMLKARLYYIDK